MAPYLIQPDAPTTESRRLPLYDAGAVEVPFGILGMSEVMDRDTFWEEHSHPTHELLWNDRGASWAMVGQRIWTITPLTGLWVPAGVRHSGWAPSGTWHRAAQFDLRVLRLSEEPVAVDVAPLLRLLLDRLQGEGLSGASRGLTERMIADVMAPAEHELTLRIPDRPLLAPIVDAVRADPADATTLTQWAGRLGVSTRTVTRAFLASTGLGFGRWVAAARMHHAIALIAHGVETEEVAERVGFGSSSAFITAFRRVTGTTPGRFRSS